MNNFVIKNNVLVEYKGTSSNVIIPEGVTRIGEFVFEGTDVVSVSIPEGVTHIEQWAFSRCKNLVSVTIPESVMYIGMGAFCDCESLTAITIPDGVQQINMHTFQNCKSLSTVTVPDSVKRIGESAFQGCDALETISVPESLTDIDPIAFADCKSLADQDGFVIINEVLYDYFGQILDVKIPAGVRKISRFHIHDRRDCVIRVLIPDSVTQIEKNAFGWYGAFWIAIPASVTQIGEDALSCGYRTVCVSVGSYAEQYAKENDIPYVLI